MGKKNFKNLTTFKTGGEIKYFFGVKDRQEVKRAVSFAKKHKLPIFILGGGSDILVNDRNFEGVVIKYMGDDSKFRILNSKSVQVTVEAGMIWDDLVAQAVRRGWQGLECLSAIPGTVGAAPIQNIGAYGQELSDVFVSLTAYDIQKDKFVEFSKKECRFGYRESIFKKKSHWQKYLIVDITLKLRRGTKPNSEYESLKLYLPKNPTLSQVREAVIKVRSSKLEDWKQIPNAGSFFKNPIISAKDKDRILKEYSDAKIYPFENKYKISAGWLVESAGWKGKSLGNVKVSNKHALIITNPGGRGSADEIKRLAEAIQADVYKKFKIKLEPEVQYINF